MMKSMIILPLAVLWSGCTMAPVSQHQARAVTAANVKCAEQSIDISEQKVRGYTDYWVAECGNTWYTCSKTQFDGGSECHEQMPYAEVRRRE